MTRRSFALLVLVSLAAGAVAAQQLGYVERLRGRLWGRPVRLSAGDFPAGVSAPVDDVASVPLRTTLIGYVPRGSSAGLLLADRGGFKNAYALDARAVVFTSEAALQQALIRGGDNGGVDLACLPVSQLGLGTARLRDAAPRTVMLVGRSRGQDVLGAVAAVKTPADLKGRRLGTEERGPSHYFALWVMSRAGLTVRDVTFVKLDSPFEAGAMLKSGRVDAVAGLLGDVGPAVHELGGTLLASSVDAPHLVATVLVARGDFAARYPDAVRRVVRALLDSAAAAGKDLDGAARALGEVAPQLGDPAEAIRSSPPASLKENLAFFGLSGESPVTYRELLQSATSLGTRLYGSPPASDPDDTLELSALKYVSVARGN